MGRFSWQVVATSGLPQAWKPLHFPLRGHPGLETSFSPTPIFGGATISFDAAWDAASLCTPHLPTPPQDSHRRACAARPMQATASASARASASAPETPFGRAPGGWGAVPRCASPSIAPAQRVPAPLAPGARLLSILRPGSNPRSHWCGRARHWEGAAAGGGSKLVERRGPPLRAAPRKAEGAEEGAPPFPRPQPLTPARGRSMRAQPA